jgi:hypothetical protein
MASLIFSLFKKISDHLTATMAALTFLLVFAFAHHKPTSVFNFVSPYHYEVTHGIFLSFLLFHQFMKYLERGLCRQIMVMGFITGLVFLTKTEIFMATIVAIVFGILLKFWQSNIPVSSTGKHIILFFLSGLVPALLFLGYFSFHMPLGQAWATIIYPWSLLSKAAPLASPFYQEIMGINRIGSNILNIIYFSLAYGIIFSLFIFLNGFSKRFPIAPEITGVFFSFMVLGTGFLMMKKFDWYLLTKPLPFWMIAFGTAAFFAILQKKTNWFSGKEPILSFVLIFFSFILLFKVILNAGLFHFGFALVMPAALIMIKFIIHDLCKLADRLSGNSLVYRFLSVSLILYFFSGHLILSNIYYKMKDRTLGQGADRFYVYTPNFWSRDLIIGEAMDYINQELGANDDFVAFPRGVMLNYLTRHENKTGYTFLDPFAIDLFGEDNIIKSLQKTRPSYIILVNWSFAEFGKTYFGRDFGQWIYSWILINYETTRQMGAKIIAEKGFGIQIMKRK